MLRAIADRFAGPLTVADVAAAANLSESHAMALFRDVMGASIGRYLLRTRLSHACMLLHATGAKVVTVAMDSGFPSASAFHQAFRAELGTTPARFRREFGNS